MNETRIYSEGPKAMTVKDFDRLSAFISDHCGIKMPRGKKTMLESRLQKRLRTLGVVSFASYCDYLFKGADGTSELVHMIDAVTTNKTDFFREPVHFDFLMNTALTEFMKESRSSSGRPFTVWSAGCSSGEEPYTLAIVLKEFAAQYPDFKFSIIATDISTKVLEKARLGIYDQEQIQMIPLSYKQKYFLRSKDRKLGHVRIVPGLRAMVRFQRLNLMDEHFAMPEALVDALFCRNVMIYFDRETQQKLLHRFCRYLKKGGYLFLGHSETVHGFEIPLKRIASTIYQKAS